MKNFILIILLSIVSNLSTAQKDDHKNVIQTVKIFFEGINSKDTAKLNSVIFKNGIISSIRGSEKVEISELGQFPKRLIETDDKYLERMWEPEIKVDQNLALLWISYDFHENDDFSHCGTDAFSLIKTSGGWKIVSVVYNVYTDNCESPLESSEK